MKVKCNRIISVVLAFLLVFSCFFSTFGFVSATQDNTQLLESIKTAWSKVEIAPEVIHGTIWNGSEKAAVTVDPEINVNTYSFDNTNNVNITGSASNSTPEGNVDIDDYDSIYVYIKSATAGDIKFSLISRGGKSVQYTHTVSPDNIGDWMKVEVLDTIKDSGNSNDFNGTTDENSYFGRIQFNSSDANPSLESSVVMGVKTFKAEFGFNLDTTDIWTLQNWIDEALKFDFTKYENSEELIEILNSNVDYLAAKLRKEWKNLKLKPEVIHATIWDNKEIAEVTVDPEINVNTYSFNSTNDVNITGSANNTTPEGNVDIDDYDSIYIYVKSATAGDIKFVLVSRNGNSIRYTHNVSADNTNKWMKVEVLDTIKNSNVRDYFNGTTNAKSYFGRLLFNKAHKNPPLESSVVMGVKKFVVSINLENLDPTQLLEKAGKLDLTEFDDTKAFEAAREKLEKCLSATDDNHLINKIKEAWSNVEIAPEVLLDTLWYQMPGANSTPSEINTETEIAGLKVNTCDCIGETWRVSSKDIYNNSNSSINVDKYDSIYVYVKPAAAGQFRVQTVSSKNYKSVYFTGDSSNGEWTKLDLLPTIKSSSNYNYYNGTNTETTKSYFGCLQNRKSAAGYVDLAQVSVVMGVKTFEGEFGFNLDETADWTLEQWLKKASKFDFTKYENSEELIKILNGNADNLITKLREEWRKLKYNTPVVIHGTFWNGSEKAVVTVDPEINVNTYSFDNTNSVNITGLKDNTTPEGNVDVDDYDSIYVYIKSATAGNIKFSLISRGGKSVQYTHTVSADNTNKWMKVEVLGTINNDNFNGTADDKSYFGRIQFANNPTLESSVVMGVKKAVLPTGTDSWNLADWVLAANKIDLNSYSNTEDFVAALEMAKKYVEENNLESTVKFAAQAGDFSDEDVAGFGDNILAEENYKATLKADNKVIQNNNNYPFSRLYDGKANGETDSAWTNSQKRFTKRDDGYLDICFDLGSNYKLDKFFINHTEGSMITAFGLCTGRYEIYASVDLMTLCFSENRVIYYDNMSDSTNGRTTVGQLFNALDDGVIARYVCFRILTPFNDDEKAEAYANTQASNPRYTRIRELGIYGEPYTAPLSETNLLDHTPVNVYRTDSAGIRTEIPETEFGYQQYLLLYDGKYDASANILRNSSTVDFVFNLFNSQKIDALGISTATESIKHLKIYASSILEAVWKEECLIFEYKVGENSPEINEIIKRFEESKEMKYVRFSILDAEESIDITEMHILGSDDQKAKHHDIIGNNVGLISTYTQDKSTNLTASIRIDANRGDCKSQTLLSPDSMTDMDLDTVYDFMMGEKGKKSLNFLIDLDGLSSIDTIMFNSGGSERYFPTNMNFYIGTDEKKIFDKDAEPIKTYSSAEENGNYEYNFLPKSASCVRIEVLDNSCDYYYENLVTVVSEIMVNGIKTSAEQEDAIVSFKDDKTGIKVDILSKFIGDMFEGVTGIKVTERAPTADEISQGTTYGIKFNGKIYTIQLLDFYGKVVTDIEGREVRVSLPIPDGLDMNSAYVGSIFDGDVKIIDHTVEKVDDVWCMIVIFEDISNLIVAPISFNEDSDGFIEILPDDSYVDNLSNNDIDTDFEASDDDTDVEASDDDTVTTGRKKYYKKIRKGTSGIETWVIILIIVVSVILVAGIILLIIFRKKIFKRKN